MFLSLLSASLYHAGFLSPGGKMTLDKLWSVSLWFSGLCSLSFFLIEDPCTTHSLLWARSCFVFFKKLCLQVFCLYMLVYAPWACSGSWELNPGPVKDQVLLTTAVTLQPWILYCILFGTAYHVVLNSWFSCPCLPMLGHSCPHGIFTKDSRNTLFHPTCSCNVNLTILLWSESISPLPWSWVAFHPCFSKS